MTHRMVDVRAVRPFRYQETDYLVGDAVTMRPVEAAAYARKGLVTLSTKPEPRVAPEPEPEPVRPRRSYRRRDLVAEQSTNLTPADPE